MWEAFGALRWLASKHDRNYSCLSLPEAKKLFRAEIRRMERK